MTLLVPGYHLWPSSPLSGQPVAVALGIFDGVHLGHRALLRVLCDLGRHQGCTTAALTFHPHPVQVLRPNLAPQLIEPIDARVQHMRELGLDAVVVHPFCPQTARIHAEAFVRDILVDTLHVRHVVVGADFVFGHRQQGNVALLQALGRALGFEVHPQAPVRAASMVASSTKIREFVRRGALAGAQELLGRPYRLYGRLTPEGSTGRWQVWGPSAELMPAPGLYAGWAQGPGRGQQGALVQVAHEGNDDERTVQAYAHPVEPEDALQGPYPYLSIVDRLHALPMAVSAHLAPPQSQDLEAARDVLRQHLNNRSA